MLLIALTVFASVTMNVYGWSSVKIASFFRLPWVLGGGVVGASRTTPHSPQMLSDYLDIYLLTTSALKVPIDDNIRDGIYQEDTESAYPRPQLRTNDSAPIPNT